MTAPPVATPPNSVPPTVHIPVQLSDILAFLTDRWGQDWSGRTVIDGTFGGGGYTTAFLHQGAMVHAFDLDPAAIQRGAALQGAVGPRLQLHQRNFAELATVINTPVSAVVLDLGISSDQLDNPERGLSYQHDGPLDMRLGGQGPTAADVLNTASVQELQHLFRTYGDEPRAKKLADLITQQRPLQTTRQFFDIIEQLYPFPPRGQARRHPAQRLFQAVRIAVNGELASLEIALTGAIPLLAPGGVCLVVTFHSLEDRLVKQIFRSYCVAQEDHLGRQIAAPRFRLPVRKIVPSEQEIVANPRARSATIRVLERVAP